MFIGWLTCIPAVLLPHSPCRFTTANAPANRQMPIASVVSTNYKKKKVEYKTAIEIYDKLNADDKTKEIYAHFGLAVFLAQSIEQQSINMIAICRQAKGNIKTFDQVNALWDNYHLGSRTLGVLINEIKQLYNLSNEDTIELGEVLKLRNYITHDYFRFNSELFYSDSGQKRMIKDFIDFQDRIQLLDSKLIDYTTVYIKKIGLTDEKIIEIFEQSKKEWKERIITENYNTITK
jgi:hypothetical protein